MMKSNWPDEADFAEWQPMRREHDRIALIESRVRSAILGTAGTNRSSFLEAAQFAAGQVVLGMEEALVEVWLRDLFSWNSLNAPMWATASCGFHGATSAVRRDRPPDDLILAVMTAGRPLRFDDAADHHLVQEWATNAGVAPASLAVFLGLPIRMNGQNLGVLAIATSSMPSVEHVALLDAIVDYLAVGAQIAHLHYQLQTQRELAQTVLREAPLAMAVVTPGDATIVLTNLRFDQLLHLGPDLWGRQLDVALPDHGPTLRKVLQLDEVARGDETRVMLDMPVQLAEGLTYWDFTSSPLHDETGAISGILISGADVTSRVVQRQRQKRSVDIAQERVAQMVMLHHISLEVASQFGQDPHDLLRLIVEKMAALVDATGGMVYYADRETGDLEVVVSSGFHKDYTRTRLHRGEGLAGRVVVTGQGQVVEDYLRYPLRASVFADEPFGAVAAIPMKQRGIIIGVICLAHELRPATLPARPQDPDEEARHTFTPEDLWLLELFAHQAAHAIENARNYLDLERAYQQQRAVDRQKDDFLARASHDLRLPLTSVVGFLDLALEQQELPPDMHTIIQQAADEAQRMREMLDELLAQSRMDSNERVVNRRRIELAPVIAEVVGARNKQVILHRTNHDFVTEIPANLAAMADLARLKEVLENLLSNAVKYSPEGGTITVTARRDASRGMVVVSISDHGIGIPAESSQQIFERFSRVDSPLASEIRGTGLGLYLARQLVESMGGTIWLDQSTPGKGSTFMFTLPAAEE